MANKCLKLLIKVGLLYCLVLCLACDNNSDSRQEDQKDQREEQPTDVIEMNTNWKLVAFVETGNNIKIPEELLKSPKAYTLLFKDDGSYEGYTNANKIKGTYEFISKTGKITIKLKELTQVADLLYGNFEDTYLDTLFKKIYSYSQSEKGLYLYYGKESYLKYQFK